MLKLLKLRLLQHNLFESITYKHTYVHVLGAGCGHFRIIFMITPSSKCWKLLEIGYFRTNRRLFDAFSVDFRVEDADIADVIADVINIEFKNTCY